MDSANRFVTQGKILVPKSGKSQLRMTRLSDDAMRATDVLLQRLFGDGNQIFALLDGNRIPNLPELLDGSTLDHACLFQGLLAENAGDAAPWIVQLDPTAKLARQLLTERGGNSNPIAFWAAHPGIYLRGQMTLDHLRRHLRRFLRVEDLAGKAYFFRFWEPDMAATYFAALNDRPELVERWFHTREGVRIDALVIPGVKPVTDERPPELIVFEPLDLPDEPEPPTGAFTLNAEDVERFRQVILHRDIDAIIQRVETHFPEITEKVTGERFYRTARQTLSRMMEHGFSQKSNLLTLLVWEFYFGPQFESRDPEGKLDTILLSDADEAERFESIRARLEELNLPEQI